MAQNWKSLLPSLRDAAAAGPGAGKAFAVAGTFDSEDAVAAEGFTAADVENGRADTPAVLAGSGAGDGAADGGRGQGGAVFDHDGGTGLIPPESSSGWSLRAR